MSDEASPRPGRSVTSKVASILTAFSPATPELSLNELARRAGLPVSTTYRLASELVEFGALERAEGAGYRIGLRLWEMGSLSPRSVALNEIVLPFMQDLYEATHENIHLAVLDGHEALYVERITGRRSVSVRSRRGGRLPLHATGVGKVLLAYAPDEFQREVLSGDLERFSPYTIVAPGLLRRQLREVHRSGVAIAREELTVGRVAIATPLLDAEGRAVAAMSIVLSATGADVKSLIPALRTAALCASRQLRERGSLPPVQPNGARTSGPRSSPQRSVSASESVTRSR
jgi:DNA-binding IclR family transcriptional regulator